MKKYKLLKDLPFAKAGDILSLERSQEYGYFKLCKDRSNPRSIELYEGIVEGFIDNFDEWFEEVKDYFYITTDGFIWVCPKDKDKELDKNRKLVGNYFETKEEAEEHLEWLKARTILLGDVKPHDGYNHEWGVRFDRHDGELYVYNSDSSYVSEIIFSDENDAYNSIEKHEDEWRTYFGVE